MGLFTKSELTKKTRADLLELAEKHSLDYDEDATKADLIALLLEVEAPDDEEVDDTEEDDEEIDDSEEEPELPDDEEEDDVEVIEEKPKPAAKKTKYTESGKSDDGEKLLGAKEVATQLGTDAKTLRQFFRSGKSTHFTAVGAGGRYEFKESDVEKIGAEFNAWKANKPGRGRGGSSEGGTSTRKRGAKVTKPEDTIEEIEEIEELEDLEDLEEDDLELED